jgi:hypothetical protein
MPAVGISDARTMISGVEEADGIGRIVESSPSAPGEAFRYADAERTI